MDTISYIMQLAYVILGNLKYNLLRCMFCHYVDHS